MSGEMELSKLLTFSGVATSVILGTATLRFFLRKESLKSRLGEIDEVEYYEKLKIFIPILTIVGGGYLIGTSAILVYYYLIHLSILGYEQILWGVAYYSILGSTLFLLYMYLKTFFKLQSPVVAT